MNYKRMLEVLKEHKPYCISGLHQEITIGYSKKLAPEGEQELWMQIRLYSDAKWAPSEYVIGSIVCDESAVEDRQTFIPKLNELIDLITKNFKNKLLEDLDLEE